MAVKNQRWSDEEFEQERKRILAKWPTGKDVDLDEAIEFQKGLPSSKNFAKEVVRAKNEGKTLIQPRGGVALVEEHTELLKHLQEEGRLTTLPDQSRSILKKDFT